MFLEMKQVEDAEVVRREVRRRGPESPSLIDRILAAWRRSAAPRRDPLRPTETLRHLLTPDVCEADVEEQWRWLRRLLHRPPPTPGPTIRELYQAYEEAAGTVLGCD